MGSFHNYNTWGAGYGKRAMLPEQEPGSSVRKEGEEVRGPDKPPGSPVKEEVGGGVLSAKNVSGNWRVGL